MVKRNKETQTKSLTRNKLLILGLSLFFTLFTIYLLPLDFNKIQYTLNNTIALQGQQNLFADMDGNGITERLSFGNNYADSYPTIHLRDLNDKVYNQWNIKGDWPIRFKPFIGDYDHDGYKELYCMSISNDSIFLHGIECLGSKDYFIKDLFICKAGENHKEDVDINTNGGFLFDSDRDGKDELYFNAYAGFSKYPRNLFRYNIVKEELIKSPRSGVGLSLIFSNAINKDTLMIFGVVSAPGNYIEEIPFKDSSSYAMAFNQNLDFIFPPLKLNTYPGWTKTLPFEYKHKKSWLALSASSNAEKLSKIKLYILNYKGNIIKQIDLPNAALPEIKYQIFRAQKKHAENILCDTYGNIYTINPEGNLRFKNKIEGQIIRDDQNFKALDIYGDRQEEFALFNSNQDALLILDDEFKLLKVLPIPKEFPYPSGIYTGNDASGNRFLFVQLGSILSYFILKNNPLYYFRIPIYLGIFISIYLFFVVLNHYISKRALERVKKEQELLKLQYTSTNNQLSPHFILNALNSISGLYIKNETLQADKAMSRFSNIIRHSLLNSDKIAVSLREELEFTRNFIEVQKMRFNHCFNYSIEVDEEVNPEEEIPRMLIHSFTENAIKHGLVPKKEGGMLKIRASLVAKKLQIEIEDNGIGRDQAKLLDTGGTGKGLGIVDNILHLYKKISSTEINYQIIDQKANNDKACGTLIKITINRS